jgi:hypothetical protein
MRKAILILAFILTSCLAFPQEAVPEIENTEPKFTAAVDFVYPYLWRGLKYNGDKVAFQPYMNYAFTDKLNVGFWASTNFSNAADAYNEFDWSISYKLTPIVCIMLSDYYWPATKKAYEEDVLNSRASYFNYSESSAHTLDFSLMFDFCKKGIPLDFQWSTLIGGNDCKYNANGNRVSAYSSYVEIGYTYSLINKLVKIRPFVGAAIINGGYYGTAANGETGFTFSNVGLNIAKEFKISENYNLPFFIRYTNNDFGIQEFDNDGKLTKTVRNLFSAGFSFKIK